MAQFEGLFGSFRNGGGGGAVVIIKARQSSRMYQSPGNSVFIMTFTVSFLKTVEEGTWFWCKSCQGQVQLVPVSSLYPRVLDLGQGGASFQILPHPPPVTVTILTLRSLFSLHSKNHNTSKCFLFETQKCKIAEISNIFRSATILPLCTKDLINVHTYKNTVCITYVQYMCKMYGLQTWYGIDLRGTNSKYKGIMVFLLKNNIKAIPEWTPDCHNILFLKRALE